jgi:hypothetical protein
MDLVVLLERARLLAGTSSLSPLARCASIVA